MVTMTEHRRRPRPTDRTSGAARAGSAASGRSGRATRPPRRLLRAAAVVGPLLAAALAVAGSPRALVPVPAAILPRLAWGLVVERGGDVTLFVVAAGLRRLLPLAALLRLSLAFPDQAPSRFRIARRTATLQQSQARVAAAMAADDTRRRCGRSPAAAIRRCLELVGALAHHDRITRGHCERVRAYCNLIGEELGLGHDDLQRLQWAGLLHDVGKVGVPAKVLNKQRPPHRPGVGADPAATRRSAPA